MVTNPSIPIILLVYANDRIDPNNHLRNLSEEIACIRDALQTAEQAGLCKVLFEPNATVDTIFSVFQNINYRDRIAILHYAGHANGYQLLLESASGGHGTAYAEGLAAFLGQQRALELVFLNGCSTEQQAQGLLDANCSAVIATSQAIDDQVAMNFASFFYQSIGGGASIERSYNEAIAAIKTQKGSDFRALYWGDATTVAALSNRFPWELKIKQGAESVRRWNLPDTAGDPLFGLPKLPKLDIPESPFRHIYRFEREHAEIFFGRGFQIRELFQAVTTEDTAPIILFYGQSGVGKSSVLDAGLLPRLEETHLIHYLRRDQSKGLLGTLLTIFGDTKTDVGVAWHNAEREKNRPMLVVLDQVEEVFTLPNKKQPDELAIFIESLLKIFGQPMKRPRGKLILGFRKEWLPEIDASLKSQGLYYYQLFLDKMDHRRVIEAITEPADSEKLKKHFKLEIDDGLAEEIADDLLSDYESPIAPTLQILLSKFWEQAKKKNYEHPRFTRDDYHTLRKEGILLGDFLKQQLDVLEQWGPEVVQSGLVLDVLAYHTTSKGTAAQCTQKELKIRYQHNIDIVESLVEECKKVYLLADIPSTQLDSIKGTRLAHDTLAPLVREQFDESDLLGQRARRILENRSIDWANGKTGTVLDASDLAVVESGVTGMRVWTEDEKRLVSASREEVQRKQEDAERQQQALQETKRQIEVGERERELALRQREQAENISESLRLASEARLASKIEPETALLVAWEALLWNRNELTADVFRETLDNIPASVRQLCDFSNQGYRMSAGYINQDKLVFVGFDAGQVWLLSLTGETVSQFTIPGQGKLGICAINEYGLLLAVRDQYLRLYNLDGLELAILNLHPQQSLKEPKLSFNANGICFIRSEGYGWVIKIDHVHKSLSLHKSLVFERSITDFLSEKGIKEPNLLSKEDLIEFDEQPWHSDRVYRQCMAPSSTLIVTVSSDGTARIWNTNGILHSILIDPEKHRIDSVEFLEGGKKIVTGTMHQGDGYIWSNDGELLSSFKTGKGGGDDLFIKAVNQSGDIFATTNRLTYEIDLWSSSGEFIGSLSGHTDQVRTAAFSADSKLLVSGSNDRTVRVWDCQKQSQLMVLHGHTHIVINVEFSKVRQREIMSISFDGSVRIWSLDAPSLPAMHNHQKTVYMMARTQLGTVISSDGSTTCLWDLNREPEILSGKLANYIEFNSSHSLTSIATIQQPNILKIWKLPTAATEHTDQLCEIKTLGATNLSDISCKVIISPDESRFLVMNKTDVNLYLTSGKFLDQLIGIPDNRASEDYNEIKWAGFNPIQNLVFTAAVNGMVWLWSSTDGSPTGVFIADNASPDRIFDINLDPLGEFILVCIRNSASLWTWEGKLSYEINPLGYKVWKGCFSLDGSRIVTIADNPSGSPSYVAQIWNRQGNWNCRLIAPDVSSSSSIEFDPKNRYVCLSSSNSVRIYDFNGKQIGLLRASLGISVNCFAISSDGENIAVSFSDGIVKIWSFSKKQRTANFITGRSNCMLFSSDSRRLVVATPEGVINQYAIHVDDLFQAAAERVDRMLTEDEIARFAIQQPVKLNVQDYRV